MTVIQRIQCKDCPEWFSYSEEVARQDRLLGRSPPERCPSCRPKHSKEYRSLGVSHYDVLQLRGEGCGGLAHYQRNRAPTRETSTERLPIEPFPIEAVIGSTEQPGTLLHGLLRDSRRVHLVVGPTGSGKSTWLPFRLLTCEELTARGPIVVTEPRIPATEAPPRFIAKMYYGDDRLVGPGLAIGYRYSEVGSTMMDVHANRLIFVTDGTLLHWLQSGEARRFSVAMIDEAHERSVNIDKILALLRLKRSQFPHLQVIIASATVDAEVFRHYFGGPDQVALYESQGFTYPILEVFADEIAISCPRTAWDSTNRPAAPGKASFRGVLASFREVFESSLFGGADAGQAGQAAVWEEVAEAERVDRLLGPLCWRHPDFPVDRLRYYPQFETLVWQGVMSEQDQARLAGATDDQDWQAAIATLAERSRRQRPVGPGVAIPITESIRGNQQQAAPGKPVKIGKEVRDRLIHACVDAVLGLIERDETEAQARHDRWGRRRELGWDDQLREPLPVGHILVFLPTSDNINRCADRLNKELARRGWHQDNRVLRFFREAPEQEKKLAMADSQPGEKVRKIVIGSNLAETSLTLDGLVYVVDSGLICEEYFDAAQGKQLPTILHSQAGCRQRAGRVGRKEPGEAYRLYTREELRRQAPFTTPQIARGNAESVLLDLVRAGLPPDAGQLARGLINPPSDAEMARSLSELRRFQALDPDGDVTHRGEELATIGGESFRAAQLLCEADRFGVLWEMAIFLAFMELRDCPAPPLNPVKDRVVPRDWLGLWAPTDQVIYDDADEEDHERGGPSPWDNPYLLAHTLGKRQALTANGLDDLELYLRLWQGWFSQPDANARRRWTRAHGVNPEALAKVENLLGLAPGAEKGTLRTFWAMEQKGLMRRDVDWVRLDAVRFLYAASVPQAIYERKSGDRFFRYGDSSKQRPGYFHQESVWAGTDAPARRLDGPVRRRYCAARTKPMGGQPILRHAVWLADDWLMGGAAPSFETSPIMLARRFAEFRDRARASLGQQPFQTGEAQAGLPTLPDFPIPNAEEVKGWIERYQPEIQQATPLRAKVAYIMHAPELCSRPVILVRVDEAVLPLEVVEQDASRLLAAIRIDQEIEVRLTVKGGRLWAKLASPAQPQATVVSLTPQPAPETSQRPPLKLMVNAEVARIQIDECFQGFMARITTTHHAGAEILISRPLSAASLSREAIIGRRLRARIHKHQDQRTYGKLLGWMDGERMLDIRDDWPAETVLEAEVVGPHPKHDYLVMVMVKGVAGVSYRWLAKLGGIAVQATPGRRLRVRVTAWQLERDSPWPRLNFVEWISP